MRRYLLRRLALLVPTLLGVSIIAFGIMHLIPGDVVDALIGTEATLSPEARETLRRILGVDQPVYRQYLTWLGGLLRGDFGVSLISRAPVAETLLRGLPVTLELAILSTLIALIVGLPLGIVSAIHRRGWTSAGARFFGLLGLSLPNFWLAIMLLLGGARLLHWSPALIYVPLWDDPRANLEQLLLPAISLSVGLVAVIMRMTRSSMLEVLNQDFIRTARAKGLREASVVLSHGLRNALIPVVTMIGIQFAYLLGGAVVIEQIFGLPGLGWLLMKGILQRDYPVVQGGVLFITFAFMTVNLVVDVVYAWLDPRIAYE
ncbi:MAG: peptide/nickel transport system permease protein [Thermomicrobiales bacterium]|jgi:peptide/nickel transport system permease protein|nr:peptide/nickel transport system permease protein [Thermomicrobiales bacterium]MEA2596023.1 peptide/nickel transport system permease protein [Thermomicrobiales bacterium]